VIRDAISASLNIRLDDSVWEQASLPVRFGGVGVREIRILSPSAFLSSCSCTSAIVQSSLPADLSSCPDPLVTVAMAEWVRLGGVQQPSGAAADRQRSWDDSICSAIYNNILLRADTSSRARLLDVATTDAGAWIHAPP
jgi:hypothetical protein